VKLRLKTLSRTFFYTSLMVLFITAITDESVSAYASSRMFSLVEDVPSKKCALVLGASKNLPNGRPNYYFVYRMRAAAELYKSGKIEYIVVSGDNSREGYDEASDMMQALMDLGVPEELIYLDYAGFRTLDSVVRVKAIFGQKDVVIVSQPFHNERALCIAGAKGIRAVAYNAEDLNYRAGFLVLLREKLARVKMVLDLCLGVQPKYYGPQIAVGT
jgi:SanA protein